MCFAFGFEQRQFTKPAGVCIEIFHVKQIVRSQLQVSLNNHVYHFSRLKLFFLVTVDVC